MCDRKAVIKNADMSEEMQQDAVDCATQALEKFNIEKVGVFIFFFVFSAFRLQSMLLQGYHHCHHGGQLDWLLQYGVMVDGISKLRILILVSTNMKTLW